MELDEQEQAALTAVFAGYNVLIAKDTIAEKAFKAGRAYRPELPEEREALERVQAILFSGASKEMVRVVWNAARDFFRPAPGGEDEPKLSPDAHPDDIEINEQCLDRLREKEAEVAQLRERIREMDCVLTEADDEAMAANLERLAEIAAQVQNGMPITLDEARMLEQRLAGQQESSE